MRLRVEVKIERPLGVVLDFVARDHWRDHPRWDPNVIEMIPLESADEAASRLTLIGDTRAQGAVRYVLPVEGETPSP